MRRAVENGGGGRERLRRAVLAAEGGEAVGEAGDVSLGGFEALAGLVDDGGRGLGREAGVVQLGLGLVGFLAGGGQVLVHAAALGGDVDGAGRVEFDGDAFGLDRRGGGEAIGGRGEPEQEADGLLVGGGRAGLQAL